MKNEMDGTHSTYGGEELNKGFWWGGLRDGDHLDDPGVGEGRDNIKMDLQEVLWEGTDWTDLVQDRGKCWAPVNVLINLQAPKNVGNFLTS